MAIRAKTTAESQSAGLLEKGRVDFVCRPEDIEAGFGGLRSSVEAANQKYTTHLKHKAEKNEKKKLKRSEEELAARQAIHEVIQRLQFS